jgi:L-xylulokinase
VADERYFLGLDAGNTVIKAVLFDAAGSQIGMSALDGRSHQPAPGQVERDLGELWSNACVAIRDCVERTGVRPERIAGIGCAGHGNGLYLVDAKGEPLIGIQSLDSRAASLAGEMNAAAGDRLHTLCLQKPWPSQTPVLLAWIKRYRPEIYERAATLLLCKDFINFRLTGNRRSDISDMSGCGLLKMPEGRYDGDLLAHYGLVDAAPLLPLLADPSEIIGQVSARAAAETGLAEGTPVIAGYFDVVASAMGSGVVAPGSASIIAGTWSINQVFSSAPAQSPDIFMVANFGPGRFANIESSATSAANLEWYVREFVERGGHHDDPFGYCNARAADVQPAEDDPIFHPFLYGSREGAEFRAGFYGIAGWHKEGHLLRAILEGVMFEHRRHIEVLRDAGLAIRTAVLSGGGARSPLWPQIFADGLGVQITIAQARETGALGAAIGAAVGTGTYPDYETAIATMTRPSAIFLPDASMRAHYDIRYGRYRDLTDAMRRFWPRGEDDDGS